MSSVEASFMVEQIPYQWAIALALPASKLFILGMKPKAQAHMSLDWCLELPEVHQIGIFNLAHKVGPKTIASDMTDLGNWKEEQGKC